MKKLLVLALILISNLSFAQFKTGEDKEIPAYKNTNNLILGFINPNNFSMRHSFNVSMMTTAYGNVSVTSYINSLNYRISNKLDVSADIKFQYSPYASSPLGSSYSNRLQQDLSGITLSRASLNYRISDNAFINLQYRNIDQSDYLNNFYSPFYNNFGYYDSYNNGWR